MKKLLLIFAIAALMSVTVFAQTRKAEQAKAWKDFQAAIVRNDRRVIASMIEFPFQGSIAPKDLNIKTEAAFLKNYDTIFSRASCQKITRGKIVSIPGADEFHFEMLENGAYHVFTFRKIGGVYKLVGTMAAG